MKNWVRKFIPALKFVLGIMDKLAEYAERIGDWLDKIIEWAETED